MKNKIIFLDSFFNFDKHQEGFDPEIFDRKSVPRNKEKFFKHCSRDFVFIASSKWEDRKGEHCLKYQV